MISEGIGKVCNFASVSPRFESNYSSILNFSKINKIALFSLALHAVSSIPGAMAGPFAYATCIAGCELTCDQAGLILAPTTAGWSLLAILGGPIACPIICAPVLAAPSP